MDAPPGPGSVPNREDAADAVGVGGRAERSVDQHLAEDPREPFDFLKVNQMVDSNNWLHLENYIIKHLPATSEATAAVVHSGPILRCRTGQLMKLISPEERIQFFETSIRPLEAFSMYSNAEKLKAAIDHIYTCIFNNIPINLQANIVKKEIRYYMMLYFPSEARFEQPKKYRSLFRQFITVDELDKSISCCLLCQQPVNLNHQSVKSAVGRHLRMPCPFITERAKEMFQAALEAESNSTFARRARSPSIARLDRFGDVKRLARTAIDTVLRIGKIYMSKERHEENFSDLVGTLLGVLSSISKSAVVAKSSSCPEGLQKIVKEGITDACSKALSKVNDCSNSYYSFQQEESQFFQLSDMVFNISKSAELTEIYPDSDCRDQELHGRRQQQQQQQQHLELAVRVSDEVNVMSENALPPPLEEDAGHYLAPLAPIAADVTSEGDLQSVNATQLSKEQSPATIARNALPLPSEEDAGHYPAPLAADVTSEGDLQSGNAIQLSKEQCPATVARNALPLPSEEDAGHYPAPLAADVPSEGDLQSGNAIQLSKEQCPATAARNALPLPSEEDAGHYPAPLAADVTSEGDPFLEVTWEYIQELFHKNCDVPEDITDAQAGADDDIGVDDIDQVGTAGDFEM